jgi:hypothetical protein
MTQLDLALRWEGRRSVFVPPAHRVRASELEAAPIATDTGIRDFVATHHYARGLGGSRRRRFGCYRRGVLVGVAVFGVPFQAKALRAIAADLTIDDSLELQRFVLLPDVGFNGETIFLAQCFRLLARDARWRAILSYSDPLPRVTLDGIVTTPGHIGQIYQAHNGRYLGRAKTGTMLLLPDATSFHPRGATKIRQAESGWLGRVRHLQRFGADALAPTADAATRAAWLDRWLPTLTRPIIHPGTHKYAWVLDHRTPAPLSHPYPRKAA